MTQNERITNCWPKLIYCNANRIGCQPVGYTIKSWPNQFEPVQLTLCTRRLNLFVFCFVLLKQFERQTNGKKRDIFEFIYWANGQIVEIPIYIHIYMNDNWLWHKCPMVAQCRGNGSKSYREIVDIILKISSENLYIYISIRERENGKTKPNEMATIDWDEFCITYYYLDISHARACIRLQRSPSIVQSANDLSVNRQCIGQMGYANGEVRSSYSRIQRMNKYYD